MRGMGWTAIVVGAVLVIWSIFATTTVHSDMTYIPGLGVQEAKDIINIGLLQQQMMLLESGIGLAIIGTILVSVGELVQAMSRAGTAKEAPHTPVEGA